MDKPMKYKTSKKPRKNKQASQDSDRVFRQFFDKDENRIRVEHSDLRIYIYLMLKSDGRKRHIGTVTKSTRTFFVTRKRAEHLHYTSNSYGFNHFILSDSKAFDWVNLSDEHADYKIPRKFILENGHFLHFKNSKDGEFELQIFVKLEQLEQFRIKPEEKRRF